MALVTGGLLNKQIAGELNLSEITVKMHRRQVMEKMRAGSLATRKVMRAGQTAFVIKRLGQISKRPYTRHRPVTPP